MQDNVSEYKYYDKRTGEFFERLEELDKPTLNQTTSSLGSFMSTIITIGVGMMVLSSVMNSNKY
jgi:hypothetical protein